MPEASPTTEELISRRAKPPRRTVLFINQLGKGLQGLVWKILAPIHGLLSQLDVVIVKRLEIKLPFLIFGYII